jgi:broad specificity phosphatase PhoE
VLARVPFWFLRHGETDWNAANRTQGSTDIPLNANGVAQAHAAAELLRGQDVVALVCSPLGRARQTAEIVGAALGLEPRVLDGLREANFGAHEGEVMGAWFAAWVAGEAAPDRGESFAEVRDRAMAAMNEVLAGLGPALVVGHGGFFRTVRAAMGFTAAVRTPNGVPLWCAPEGDEWRMDPRVSTAV